MRNSKFTRRVLGLPGLLAAILLVGCGSENTLVNPGAGTGPTVPIEGITLIVSTNVLPSDGSSAVILRAVVRDRNNNIVDDAPVTYSADSGLLRVLPPDNDEGTGLPRAELTIAGDPTNRPITVTATTGSHSDSVVINVTGTELNLVGPNSVVQGDTVPFVGTLRNSGGSGIPGRTVEVSSAAGNELSAEVLTTNSQGEVNFTVTGSVGGADTITIGALGLEASVPLAVSADDSLIFVTPAPGTEIPINTSQTVTVEWLVGGVPQAGTVNFSTTRGTLSALSATLDAGGRASVNVSANTAGPATLTARVGTTGPQTQQAVEFIATTPATIVAQASRFTVAPGEQSTIIATVRDAAGNPVKNKVVQFQLEDITGGSLSVGTATTGSAGTAQTVYTGGETISGSGDVLVTAIVQENPSLTATVGLTVARRQVDISIGTGNELFEPDTASYEREFIVQVTDSQGVGVANAAVQLSVRSKYYRKGFYIPGPNDRWVVDPSAIICPDEDLNNNGQLDANEDFNNSGSIEAGNVVSVSPGEVTTDAAGTAIFRIRYAQEFGNWVVVTLTARAAVQGTEFEDRTDHALEITAADANINQSPPGGIVSRFGGSDLDNTIDPTDEALTVPEFAARLAELGFGGGRFLGCRTLN